MATATTNLSLIIPAATDATVVRTVYNINWELIDDIFDTVSLTEFGYLDGVTSAIQTQFAAKQSLDAALTNISALTYVSPSFIKLTADDTYAVRTIAEVKTDLSLNLVENTAVSTWAGSANITTLGTVTTGTISTGVVLADVTMTLGSDADGDIYYRASNVLTRLAKGTAAQVLAMNGGATAPEWVAAGGGGATTELDNLGTVAINTSLISDTSNTDDLGSSTVEWRNLYLGACTTATTGIIFKGANRYIHDFNPPDNGTVDPNGYNIFVGELAGNFTMGSTATAITQSSANTVIGYEAFQDNTTGYDNVAIGYQALKANTTAYANIAIGYQALLIATTGIRNIAIGRAALDSLISGNDNVAIGYQALTACTGSSNVAIGYQALYNDTTGYNNMAMGSSSLRANTQGFNNVAIGFEALTKNTTGDYNIAIGSSALNELVGSYNDNVAIGYANLYNTTTGTKNVSIGSVALNSNTTGGSNIGIGYYAGRYNAAESNNFYVSNIDRTNTAGDKALSLMYGIMGAAPTNQSLKVNVGDFSINVEAGADPHLYLREGDVVKWDIWNDNADDYLQIESGTTLRYEFGTDGTAVADVAWNTFSPVITATGEDLLDVALEDANKPNKPYEGIPTVKTDEELFDMVRTEKVIKVPKVDERNNPILDEEGKPIIEDVTTIEHIKTFRPRKPNEFLTAVEKQSEIDKYAKSPAKISIASARYLEYLKGVINDLRTRIAALEMK